MRFAALIVSIVAAGQLLASQDPEAPKEDPKAVIDRLRNKLFPEADDRLEASDPGARAQLIQKKIIEDLDKLLDQNDDRLGRKNKRKGTDSKHRPATGERGGKDGKRGDGMPTDRKDPGKTPAKGDRQRDIWPSMPAKKRQEMDAYGKETLLPKYEKMIREYYRTIAEESKRRESE